jgi:hypothetical protein
MKALLRGLTYRFDAHLPCGKVIVGPPVQNIMPQEGVDLLASLILGDGTAPVSNWYMGIFESNYVPTLATRAADLPGVVGECTAYSEASRPEWLATYDGVSSIDNLANEAVFTLTAEKTIRGGFICSAQTKASGGGVLISIARFDSPQTLPAGTVFRLASDLPLIPTNF